MNNDIRFYSSIFVDEYLMHHGIKGQKWGVRNGPPYPLDSDVSSKVKNGATAKSKNEPKEGFIIASTLMGTVAANLAVVAITTGVTATVALANNAKAKKLDKKVTDDIQNSKKDPKTGLPLKSREYSEKEDLKYTNTHHKMIKNDGAVNNCVRCTNAYELRRRGYNVTAKLVNSGTNGEEFAKKLFGAKDAVQIDGYEYWNPEKKMERKDLVRESLAKQGYSGCYRKTIKQMKNEPDSRGQMLIQWDRYCGHSFIYSVKNGKVKFMDAQTGQILNNFQIKHEYFNHAFAAKYQRLDNCPNINKSMLKEVVNESGVSESNSETKKKSA